MNKTLLIILFFTSVLMQINAQAPPPCGLSPVYVCDSDENGEELVNLTEKFPFNFCNINPNEAPNYEMTYYLSQEDANNATNVIDNPENFILINNQEDIFRRADAINSNTVLINSDELIMVLPPTPNTPTSVTKCNLNGNGFEVFNLNDKIGEILSGQSSIFYDVDFYQTLSDASNLVNSISNPSNFINTIPWQQTIYASVSVALETDVNLACIEVVEFNLIVQGECEDIAIYLYNPDNPPIPGFSFSNTLLIENIGEGTVDSGTVEFEYDSNLEFNSATSTDPSVVINNTAIGFSADFTNLEVGESIEINIDLTCPVSVALGTPVTNIATYTTTSDDINESNDVFEFTQIVIGAYDPNDKMESHGPEILYDEFILSNEYLFYTIRFQNIGTAAAINVRIEDILNSQLDSSTFQTISASHAYDVLRVGDDLTWTFTNINLPAEQDDPEGSIGYVNFRIKPNPGYMVGDIIPNNASIFFDFNAPIITNTFTTEFIDLLSVNDFESIGAQMYPNPADDKVSIKLNGAYDFRVLIYDIQGKQIALPYQVENDNIAINLQKLDSGIYLVQLKSGDRTFVKKIVVR